MGVRGYGNRSTPKIRYDAGLPHFDERGSDRDTNVWALDGFAYTGTFNAPCGGDPDDGVWVWDVSNPNKASS